MSKQCVFRTVGEKEPPIHKELLVQSPAGENYIASWRKSYQIFTCQNKGEDSYDWKWILIEELNK